MATSDNWSEDEAEVFDRTLDNVFDENPTIASQMADDEWLQFLYGEVFWGDYAGDERQLIYANLVSYVEDEYGYEWEDIFDWEAWREAYDAA